MDPAEIQEFRRARLKDLLDKKYGGRKVYLGRALGHASGAFVRQLIDGERPVSEKTIAQLEALPGAAGWFQFDVEHVRPKGDAPLDFSNLQIVSAEENAAYGFGWALERLADLLATMQPLQREKAARLVARLAEAPDSRIVRSEAREALMSDETEVPTWRDAAVELITEIRMAGKPVNLETLIRDIDRVHSDRLSQVSARAARRTLTDS